MITEPNHAFFRLDFMMPQGRNQSSSLCKSYLKIWDFLIKSRPAFEDRPIEIHIDAGIEVNKKS
jgi:hypothetical protein